MDDGPFGPGARANTLDLPPVFTEIALRESGDAFAHALAVAGAEGAGTLVWVRRFDVAEFAVVLEPEEPLAAARRSLYLGLVALADALAAYSPPEKAITVDWPDTMRLDGAVIGGGRLGAPEGVADGEVPPWLVFGAMLRLYVHGDDAGGTFRLGTSAEVEGFDLIDTKRVIESFSRHLMTHVDRWQEKGFKKIGEDFLARMPRETGIRRGIDGNGDLLVHGREAGPAERTALLPRLSTPGWLDPSTGMPWL